MKKSSRVRIIGGIWRSRQLRFMPTETLRPSGDRTRERVFNWLNSEITGAHCIDLFAGSGALAFEALSRGAKSCLAVDNDPRAIEWLRYNSDQLNASNLIIDESDSCLLLKKPPIQPANIVFLDPPFNTYSLLELCQDLENQQWLLSEAKIYIESSRSSSEICTPGNWMLWRHKVSGRVDMRLYTRGETKP
jgi:16S rRNA (guanine966-N2)-methyltransferase